MAEDDTKEVIKVLHSKDNIISCLISLIGAIIIVYELFMCFVSNINLGIVLVLISGIFIFSIGIIYKNIKKLAKFKFFRITAYFVAILLFIEVLLVFFILVYGISDNTDFKEDAVIVLGAGVRGDKVTMPLKMRLDKAIEYHHKNPDSLIVVTGGQGPQETVTEAYAMEKYLVENGVDKNKIIKEEKASSTYENMKFSKVILDNYFKNDYSIVVITNNFHIYRSVNIAKDAGFSKINFFHAKLPWYNLISCYLRESLAVIKMIVIG